MSTASAFLYLALCATLTAILKCAALDSEIQALLSFKEALHDPRGATAGWGASTPAAPCDWSGIVCDGGRVRELRLPRQQLSGRLSDRLGDLRQLRRLSLHSNSLNGSIPRSLAQCSLLRAVYLQYNSIAGEIDPAFLSNLTNLEVLNLAHNLMSGEIPGVIPASTRVLDLSSNSFSGQIPANLSAAHQLQLINLSFNRLSGAIPATIGTLQQLQYLWLDDNEFYGTIPSAISNCSSLVHFSAGDNTLSGVVPATIGSLGNLQVISLPRNHLTGVVSSSLLCNISLSNATIRVLNLSFNALTGIENNDGETCTSVLEVFDLHENQINGVFPNFLLNLSTLRTLDVSGNNISGALPDYIGILTVLEEFRVGNNSLTGEIPQNLTKCKSLKVLDLGKNRFSGSIPVFIEAMKGLTTLILGGNLFTGVVPTSLGDLYSLQMLDLSRNKLSGTLPLELTRLSNLSTLNLSNNRFSNKLLIDIAELKGLEVLNMSGCGFSGEIPSSVGNLWRLKTLDLSRQNLSGELPVELYGLPSLQVVALEENSFSGKLPEGFSSLSGLQYLNLSSNGFSGEIPATYGFLNSLAVLSLSGNRVKGPIPAELSNCTSLEVLELRENGLTGLIPDDFSNLSRLRELDLSQNSLSGAIPESISNCSNLVTLSLFSNHISGHIPDTLSKLSKLRDLDVSSNNLTGIIPANLSLLPALQRLNLSSNNLYGEIPVGLSSRFSNPSVYSINKNLCGKPLKSNCANSNRRRRKRMIIFVALATAGGLLLLLFCSGYIYNLIRWRKKLRGYGQKKRSSSPSSQGTRGSGENAHPKLIMFNNKITYAETLEATRNFDEENVLSRGKFGLLFKATYADGMVLAIRRLPNASIEVNTFRKEAESLGRVKHRNLTVLRGYYAGPPPEMRLMIYDYMPNGNLGTLLQEASHQEGAHVLNWPMRHLIALGIARGLAHLHSGSIVHGDVKPQNVLFDADFEAHLSDFGLEKVVTIATSAEASTSALVGSLGYVAPEVALTGQASKESDVYSFGIVVLEILTGKKPVMFAEEDEDIVKWVKRQLQRGQVSELLEPGLLELDPESSEWEEFLLGVKVGLLCTMSDPNERPLMADVVFMLEGCRLGPEAHSSADPTALPSPS